MSPNTVGVLVDGYLEENDEIWAVNDRKLVGFTHQQVVQALRTAGSEVHLVVFRRKNITREYYVRTLL